MTVVKLHIKLKEIEHSAPCMHYSVHRLLAPGARSKFEALFFLKVIMLHIKLKGMEYRAHILSLHTPSAPGGRPKGQNIFFSVSSHEAYQIKGDVA